MTPKSDVESTLGSTLNLRGQERSHSESPLALRLSGVVAYTYLSLHTFHPDLQNFSIAQTLHRHEARYIKLALEKAGGNLSQAPVCSNCVATRTFSTGSITPIRISVIPCRKIKTAGESGVDKDVSRPHETPTQEPTVRILHVEDD